MEDGSALTLYIYAMIIKRCATKASRRSNMDLKEILCKCPKCGEQFAIGDALEQQAIEQVRAELASLNSDETQLLIEAEKTKAAEEAKKQAQEETLKQTKQKQDELETVQNKLNAIELEKVTTDAQLKSIQQRQEAEIAIKLAEEKSKWDAEKINAETALKLQVQQLKDDIKLASARAEQGSMQLQGEVQELALEELLQHSYPFDNIEEVPKGIRGADCIQHVYNALQQQCGSIVYESKRTKSFANDWIDKLKEDQLSCKADVAILVSQVLPTGMDRFGEKDGVWICTFDEVKSLSFVLREMLLKLYAIKSSQENKGDKMHMLYDYLTSNTFRMQVEAIVEGFSTMKNDLESEKRSMQRIWKQREKQIDKVTTNTIDMYGSIKGIAGNAIQSVRALELTGSDVGKEVDIE